MRACGIDIVYIPDFREQIELPGTVFLSNFTKNEQQKKNAEHLAGLWAAKEAFIKAWSSSISPAPPYLKQDEVKMNEIEIVNDQYGRPKINLSGTIEKLFKSDQNKISISISHDKDYAISNCIIE